MEARRAEEHDAGYHQRSSAFEVGVGICGARRDGLDDVQEDSVGGGDDEVSLSEVLIAEGEEGLQTGLAGEPVVDGVDGAIAHIARYSSGHTEAIAAQDADALRRFADTVDAAAVVLNASTAFTDGEQYGMGAEIGISTQKLHARGPMALPELTTTKWVLQGSGQVRQ